MADPIRVGMNGRFFPNNWRPALQEVGFAKEGGFQALQFPGKPEGLSERHLGAPLADVSRALALADITTTMEIIVRVDLEGRTAEGASPLDVLRANLPAIRQLPCTHVHLHVVLSESASEEETRALERSLVPQLREAVALSRSQGFMLGIEHNEPDLHLFGTPESCEVVLREVAGLGLVWDVSHTAYEHLSAFKALVPRMMGLHVSDTPLPEVNYHLPLGLGNVDLRGYCHALVQGGFRGPAILEIGGLPKSGG